MGFYCIYLCMQHCSVAMPKCHFRTFELKSQLSANKYRLHCLNTFARYMPAESTGANEIVQEIILTRAPFINFWN